MRDLARQSARNAVSGSLSSYVRLPCLLRKTSPQILPDPVHYPCWNFPGGEQPQISRSPSKPEQQKYSIYVFTRRA